MTKTPPDKWGTPVHRDLSGVEELRKLRGVKTFEEMPLYVQRVYLEVARCFPNIQVWACGSRVRGDYIEPGDYFFVKIAREMAGMKPKKESDFDFFIYGKAHPVCALPPNTELVKCRIPEKELIAIPIFKKTNEL